MFEFEVRSYYLPCSMRKCFMKTVKKTTQPRISYNVFKREKRRIGLQSPWQRPVESQVTSPYWHLHSICIIATKPFFFLNVIELYALKSSSTHILHEISKILNIKTAIRRVFSLIWRTCFHIVNRFEHVRIFMYDRLPQFFASKFRANYPNYFRYHLKTFRIVVFFKHCLQELCKIVQSSFDGVRQEKRKLLTLKNTSCRPHSSISDQTSIRS